MPSVNPARSAWSWATSPLAVACAGLLVSIVVGLAAPQPAPPDEPLSGDVRVHGRVLRISSEPDGDAVDLDASGRVVRVRWPGFGRVVSGDHVDALLHATPITRYVNPSPALRWPLPDRAPESRAKLVAPSAMRVTSRAHTPAASLARAVDPLRLAMRDGQRATLAPRAARLARAMVLGDAHALTDEERTVLSRAGLAHLVAVSGLNVVLVVGALVWLLRALLRRIEPLAARADVTRVAAAFTLPLAAAFAALTGFQPSAIRAAVMTAVAALVVALGRRPRGAPVLGTTLLAALLLDPHSPRHPGFLLSALATLSLLQGQDRPTQTRDIPSLSNPISQTLANQQNPQAQPNRSTSPATRFSRALTHALAGHLWPRARQLWITNQRATLATAPIVLWLFGELPLVGLLANLVAVPATSVVLLPVALLHALVAALSPSAARWLSPLVEHASDLFFAFAAFVSRAPALTLPPSTAAQWAAASVATVVLLLPKQALSWRARLTILFAAAALVALAETRLTFFSRAPGLTVTFLDVGQGDSTLVELADGRRVLIDAGDAYAGERALVPYLRARRITRLDAIVVTHPHPDHAGGVAAVAKAVQVGAVWDNGQSRAETPDSPWSLELRGFRRRGIPVLEPASLCRQSPISAITVLAPCPDRDIGDDPNDASLVLSLRHGTRSFLLTGDIEARGENRLLDLARDAPHILRSDVLKSPHHGSRTSSSAAFLRAVGPSLAIASAGRGNRYRHPHAAIVERHHALAIPLLDTRRCGAISVVTDGRALTVEPTLPCSTAPPTRVDSEDTAHPRSLQAPR